MYDIEVYREAFNILCGEKIGRGISRTVFECKLMPDMVVKVESEDYRTFQNVLEQRFWDYHKDAKHIAKWLAPCHFLSPDGRVLIQSRVSPLREGEFPEKLPAFFTDTKRNHFGKFGKQIVCCDYALTVYNPSMKMIKAAWW